MSMFIKIFKFTRSVIGLENSFFLFLETLFSETVEKISSKQLNGSTWNFYTNFLDCFLSNRANWIFDNNLDFLSHSEGKFIIILKKLQKTKIN